MGFTKSTERRESGSILDEPVLILNKGWQPIDATPVRNAFADVMAEKAHFLCPQTYILHDMDSWLEQEVDEKLPCIRGVHRNIRLPRIIVSRCKKVPKKKVIFNRKNLWRRDNYRCQYCGCRPPNDEITVDHVVPKSRGGLTTFDNCVLACLSCNKRKDDKTPAEAGMRLQRQTVVGGVATIKYYVKPEIPRWSPEYATRRKKLPIEWAQFMPAMVDFMYWNTEIEP